MAVIDDLIARITDENLRRAIAAEVAGLIGKKQFGLVFENHLPDRLPLYDQPVRPVV